MVPSPMRARRPPGSAGVPPATLFVQAACDPGAFLRTEHQTGLCRIRYHGAKSYAGETPALPGGSRPQPYSCKQPAIQGHSFEQSTKPSFAGFATMVPSPMRARRPPGSAGVPPATLFVQAACDPGAFLRTEHQTGLCRVRYYGAKSYAGETPPRERGRPARNLIRASSLRSRGIPSNRAPTPPLQGSLLWCQVLCERDAPPGARASRPQPYSCKQPAIQGHSFEQSTKPSFAGFATMVPSPMRARRPRSRGGVLPFTLAPQESVSGCRAAALPCRSCERASCNIGSGTGHFAGNRDVLPISIVGCDLVEKGVHHKKHKRHKTDFVISSLGNPKLIPTATR